MRIFSTVWLLWAVIVSVWAYGQTNDERFVVQRLRLNTSRDEAFPVFYDNRFYYLSAKKIKSPTELYGSNAAYYLLPHPDSSHAFRKRVFLAQKWEEQGALAGASYRAQENTVFYSRYLAKPSKQLHISRIYSALVSDNVWYSAVPVFKQLPDTVTVLHPCISDDGKELYFAANLPDGIGGLDIYLIRKDSLGRWSAPVNLGAGINSAADEITPFIHPEGNLYFASNRPNGYGGFDIYEAPGVAGQLQACKLMPQPFNSEADDFALIMNEAQRIGYFSSNRSGNFDIYGVNVVQLHTSRNLTDEGDALYRQFEMEVTGSVIDTANRQPVRGALVKLRDVYTDDIRISFTDNEGRYYFSIKNDHKYQLGVSKVGYQSHEDIEFSTIGITEPVPLNINLLMSLPLYRQSLKVQVWEAGMRQSMKNPVSDAVLVLEDVGSGEKYEKRSDPDGSCLFIIEQGRTYKLFAEATGYQKSLPYRITINPKYMGQYIEMDVELPREEVTNNPANRYIKAIVVNQDTNMPLGNATVYLTDAKTGETRFLYTAPDGTATFRADSGVVYKLEAQIIGYQMEDYMITEGRDIEAGKTQEVLLPLKPVQYNPIPLDVTLPTIYYASDREILSEEVKTELNRILQLLTEYPGVKVAIEAHAGLHESTKNVYEIALKRANAAAAYLFKHGLARDRIAAIRSFGAERQRYNCLRKECTAEERRANRRTEFIIVYR